MTILIVCPVHRPQVTARTLESIVGTVLALKDQIAGFAVYPHTGIAESRNMLLTTWYDKTPAISHLLMVDDDMTWEPVLIKSMLGLDQPVVGTLYASRNPGYPIIGKFRDGGECRGSFVKAENVGAGILLIKRDAVARILEWIPILSESAAEHPMAAAVRLDRLICVFTPIGQRSEDLSFCLRCQESSVPIWVHDGSGVGHVGEYEFKMRYA